MSLKLNNPFVFASRGKLACASGVSTNAAGQSVQRFRKDLIRVGEYVKSKTNQQFEITQHDLDRFAATFSAMKTAGVKVPVPVGHTRSPEANRGYVEEMYRDGDTLWANIDLVGDDAIALAGRTEVSICVEPEIIDGKGTKYTNAIEHVAIVTDPVIPKQDGWVRIEASRGDGLADMVLSSSGDSSMDMLKEIAGLLGVETGADDAATMEAIKAKIKAIKGDAEASKQEAMSLKASRSGIETVSEDALDTMAEGVATKIDNLQTNGKINPAVGTKLKAILCGDNATRQTRRVLLSRHAGSQAGLPKEAACVAAQICDALGDMNIKELHGKTLAQGMTLSRDGDDRSSAEDIEKATAARVARINERNGTLKK